MFHDPEIYSPPRPPTEREKCIIHQKMLEEIEKMQQVLKDCEIDAEYIRQSDKRFCTKTVTKVTLSIFMEYDEKLEFKAAFREDPVKTNREYRPKTEWETVTKMEKTKALGDKSRAEDILKERFETFDPQNVRKVRKIMNPMDEDEDEDVSETDIIAYIIKVNIWQIFPIICMPKPDKPRLFCARPQGITLKSLSLKNPIPCDEEEESMPGGLTPSRPADHEIQKMIDKFKEKAEKKLNRFFSKFKAVSYRTQVVDGLYYSVKIATDDGYVWMMLYQPLGGDVRFVDAFNHPPDISKGSIFPMYG